MALVELPDDVKEAMAHVVRERIDEEADDHLENCSWLNDDDSRDPRECPGGVECEHPYHNLKTVAAWLRGLGVKPWANG